MTAETNEETTKDPLNLIGKPINLPMEEILANEAEIKRIQEQQKLCLGCVGDKCSQANWCMVLAIENVNGRFHRVMIPCPYEKNWKVQRQVRKIFPTVKIPAIYGKVQMKHWKRKPDDEDAVKAIQERIHHPEIRKGLYLYGNPGTGKTMLSSILVNSRIQEGQTVLFASMGSLVNDLMAAGVEKGARAVNLMKQVDTLILDDMNHLVMEDWVIDQFYEIINYRYSEKLMTVITSNLQMEEMKKLFRKENLDEDTGKRIESRLWNMCELAELKGEDYRKKLVREKNITNTDNNIRTNERIKPDKKRG